METPNYSHLTKEDLDKVYEPSEDTFLLIDAIENDLEFIENILKPKLCLEIGSGSGVVITAIAKRLKNKTFCLATDINNYACKISKKTAIQNSISIETINANLADCFKDNLFDMIIFNPPYVVTSDEECFNKNENSLVYTWAGGTDGRLIINKFLKNLEFMLTKDGIAYLLLLKENKPFEIINNLNKTKHFSAYKIIERRIIGEHLYVIKIINKKDNS